MNAGEYKKGEWHPSKSNEMLLLINKKQSEYWEVTDDAAKLFRKLKPLQDKWKGLTSKAGTVKQQRANLVEEYKILHKSEKT